MVLLWQPEEIKIGYIKKYFKKETLESKIIFTSFQYANGVCESTSPNTHTAFRTMLLQNINIKKIYW